MPNPPKELDNWIKDKLFQAVPMAIAMIDREYNVVFANAAFEKMFGNWRNQKCYSVSRIGIPCALSARGQKLLRMVYRRSTGRWVITGKGC